MGQSVRVELQRVDGEVELRLRFASDEEAVNTAAQFMRSTLARPTVGGDVEHLQQRPAPAAGAPPPRDEEPPAMVAAPIDVGATVGRTPRQTQQETAVAIVGALADGPLTLRELHLHTGRRGAPCGPSWRRSWRGGGWHAPAQAACRTHTATTWWGSRSAAGTSKGWPSRPPLPLVIL